MAKQAIKEKVVEVLAGDESYDQLLVALIQNGYSPNNLKNTLNKLNLNYSQKEIEIITEELQQRYYDYPYNGVSAIA